MTTTALPPSTTVDTPPRPARSVSPIPTTRLVGVELRKMFDTRAGFWLVAGIGIAALLATAAVIIFAPREELTYETFATAIGAPMSILLPVVAILALTGEWSQRSGLTTFTLVPHRGRVIFAKAVAILGVAIVSMVAAAAIGAVGNIVGTAIAGVDTSWNVSLTEFGYIVLANVIGMAIGFMLAVLIRNSAGAIVGYFVYTALLPTISSALASTQDWWRDNGPWLDINYASSALYNGSMTGEQWAQLGVTTLVWLWIPLAIGLRAVLRAEVK
jgi:ABC-2 type transport system permease protein